MIIAGVYYSSVMKMLFFREIIKGNSCHPDRPPEIPDIHEERVEAFPPDLLLLAPPEKQVTDRVEVAELLGGKAFPLPGDQGGRISVERFLATDQPLSRIADRRRFLQEPLRLAKREVITAFRDERPGPPVSRRPATSASPAPSGSTTSPNAWSGSPTTPPTWRRW